MIDGIEGYCPGCDKYEFYSDLEAVRCRTCKSPCLVVPPGGNWTSTETPPRAKQLCKVRFEDGSEAYAIWMPALKGFAVDLPEGFDPENDKHKYPEGKIKEWRITYGKSE